MLAVTVGCSESEPVEVLGPASSVAISVSVQDTTEITAQNIYAAEAYWPNIVGVADSWQPGENDHPRPKTLQGALIRVERDGIVRIDLARFGRVDVPIAETDLIERANGVRRGEIFKHRGNLAMQLAPMLVRSDLERPGAHSSRGIKSSELILCVFADPRSEVFPPLAAAVAAWQEGQEIQVVYIAQNVARDDLTFIHGRLQEVEWTVPYVYPERSATQTERLLRAAPSGPRVQLLTREGRELTSAPFVDEATLRGLEGLLVVKAES